MNNQNWDDIRYALAVSRHGSLNAAATALGVTHATVLRRVAAELMDSKTPRNPCAVLSIRLPADRADVNLDPCKMTVIISDLREILLAIEIVSVGTIA